MREIVTVLAHRGWDEILIFAVPVVLLYFGMRWWDSRVDDTNEADRAEEDAGPDDSTVEQDDTR